jgi:hypothetical protein
MIREHNLSIKRKVGGILFLIRGHRYSLLKYSVAEADDIVLPVAVIILGAEVVASSDLL